MRFGVVVFATFVVTLFVVGSPAGAAGKSDKNENHDWPIYGGTSANNHFSPLKQINRRNVRKLAVAWSFDTGEEGGLQTSPIVVDGVLYGLTPSQKVFALNAATGALLWKFDAGIPGPQPDRGLAYWADAAGKDRRIVVGVMNFVYALDAATGKPVASFGKDGRIDLREDLGRNPADQAIYLTSPIVVDGVLYGLTPSQKVFALNAATGALLWKFDAGIPGPQPDRGLAYWADAAGKDRRIVVGVMNFVYALDAATGKPVASFGKDGRIDLREELGRNPADQAIYLTSPAVIYKDLMIVGGRESETLPASPGDIRAYDVRSGKLRWSFHTIPHPGEFGYDTWPKDAWKHSGAANNWTGMTVDVERGIVYVPTGSAAFDFYGGDRIGDDLFANCLIALNAETGERIWHFQGVHHDLWDRDFPAPPVLATIERDGKKIDAVAQTSKQGFVYLFDRTNGTPLFPLECRSYPPTDLPGDEAAPQQCLPSKPAPYARQRLTADMLTNRTPQMHEWALDKFRAARSDGQFVPFGADKDTVIFPGFDGGAEWGGPALDPQTAILYLNSNEMAWMASLAENTEENSPKSLYMNQCAVCHGEKMAGSPPSIPSLQGIGQRLATKDIVATIRNGKGRMQGFPNLKHDEVSALLGYLTRGEDKEVVSEPSAEQLMKYHFKGYRRFLDPDGYPGIAPPWGTLNAINLNTGEYVWKITLGEFPDLAAQGQSNTGSENYGGPIVTAGGVLFIGATNFDKKFRAFDKDTGKLLWQTTLPFSGNATPATYEVKGRQFVVIGAGGGKDLKSKTGGVYVAFALKK